MLILREKGALTPTSLGGGGLRYNSAYDSWTAIGTECLHRSPIASLSTSLPVSHTPSSLDRTVYTRVSVSADCGSFRFVNIAFRYTVSISDCKADLLCLHSRKRLPVNIVRVDYVMF